jgi:putative Ca2+/H+ antiporter (TMEM165/GDT1 family)
MFFSSFALIFLASLPGRTTFILVALSSTGKIKNILLGACGAFLIQASIAVLLGRALSHLPKSALHLAAGLLFLYFARQFWIKSSEEFTGAPHEPSIREIFMLIFLAELGDVSQLAIASVAATTNRPFVILAAAIAALFSITILALILGQSIGKFIKPLVLQRVASGIFLLLGLYLIIDGVTNVLV